MLKDFGRKLKELRESKDMTQRELGQILDVQERQVQRYESGKVLPDHNKMQTLKDVFKFDFYSLLCDPSYAATPSPIDKQLEDIKTISSASLDEIMKVSEHQRLARAEIRALAEYHVMKDSGNNDKIRKQIMAQINKLVVLHLKEID